MNSIKLKRMNYVHSWLGVLFGLFIFVVVFSGILALFPEELAAWENQSLRLSEETEEVGADAVLKSITNNAIELGKIQTITLFLPTDHKPYFESFTQILSSDKSRNTMHNIWSSSTGEILDPIGKGASYWLLNFHRDFVIPNHNIGRPLVGVSGMLLMFMLVTGIIIHRKIIADLFKCHLVTKSIKMRFRSTHNALGIWGLPFYFMIAFTGVAVGVLPKLVPVVGVVAFKGDQAALMDLLVERVEPTGVKAPMYSLDKAKEKIEITTQKIVDRVLIFNWQDELASYRLLFETPYELQQMGLADVNAVSGEIVSISSQVEHGLAIKVNQAISALHYGTYAGLWLKFLYVLLGIATSLLITTGLYLWLERRLNGPTGGLSPLSYKLINGVVVGTTSGLVVASIGLLYVDRLMAFSAAERLAGNGYSFFIIWVGIILVGLLYPNKKQFNKMLLSASAILLMGMSVLDWLLTGQTILDLWLGQQTVLAGVNLFSFIAGVILAFVLYKKN